MYCLCLSQIATFVHWNTVITLMRHTGVQWRWLLDHEGQDCCTYWTGIFTTEMNYAPTLAEILREIACTYNPELPLKLNLTNIAFVFYQLDRFTWVTPLPFLTIITTLFPRIWVIGAHSQRLTETASMLVQHRLPHPYWCTPPVHKREDPILWRTLPPRYLLSWWSPPKTLDSGQIPLTRINFVHISAVRAFLCVVLVVRFDASSSF